MSHVNSAAANLLCLFSAYSYSVHFSTNIVLERMLCLLSPHIKVTTGTPLHLLSVTTMQNLFVISFLSGGLTVHKTILTEVSSKFVLWVYGVFKRRQQKTNNMFSQLTKYYYIQHLRENEFKKKNFCRV